MNCILPFVRAHLAAILGALLTMVLTLAWAFPIFKILLAGDALGRWSYDLLTSYYVRPGPAETVIIYLDELSAGKLHQPWTVEQPWDRGLHAKLLHRLKLAKARLVVFDQLFDAPHNDEADREFIAAIKDFGGVVLGAAHTASGIPGVADAVKIQFPAPVFREAAAGVGLAEVNLGPDRARVKSSKAPRPGKSSFRRWRPARPSLI